MREYTPKLTATVIPNPHGLLLLLALHRPKILSAAVVMSKLQILIIGPSPNLFNRSINVSIRSWISLQIISSHLVSSAVIIAGWIPLVPLRWNHFLECESYDCKIIFKFQFGKGMQEFTLVNRGEAHFSPLIY